MKNLKTIIEKFPKANVLVLGDLILDEYIWGNVDRISPEAPVPVVWANKRTYLPGGAANVAANLRSLGAKVSLAGVVGKDHNREIMFSGLHENGIDTKAIFIEEGRHTTLKTRIFARSQQVVRVDWEHIHELKKQTQEKFADFIDKNIRNFDAIIIEDYGKGVIEPSLLDRVVSRARQYSKVITVDPKEDHLEYYRGVSAITPNRKEVENAIRYLKIRDKENRFKIYHDGISSHSDLKKAGHAILDHLELECLLITLGEDGMWIFQAGNKDYHIPTVAQQVFDITGAGDTVIATFTLGLCSGASKLNAAYVANQAAGIVVGKIGVATVTRRELLEKISD
ncbi:MAG: D-glycero-beta-D-manno-heptose-7-phosphate kinase [Candidatus Omnitrophota bacterium]